MHKPIVQKYGGSSVATSAHMEKIIGQWEDKTQKRVVVLSAMGKRTDQLVDLAQSQGLTPPEKDVLLSTGELESCEVFCELAHKMGIKACILTGIQIPIRTTNDFGNALIEWINPQKILDQLQTFDVVIVPGFQGVSNGKVTTLGRGGSDLTAVAISIGLGVQVCEIYTDVMGVMTVDPKICGDARLLSNMDYDAMIEFAHGGAKVLQARCVTLAKRFEMPIKVRSTFVKGLGTIIGKGKAMEGTIVSGVALKNHQWLGKINASEDFDFQKHLANALIHHFQVQNESQSIGFLLHDDQRAPFEKAWLEEGRAPIALEQVSMVTLVGSGLMVSSKIFFQIQQTLAKNKIKVYQIVVSDSKIQCIVHFDQGQNAVRVLHAHFGLEKEPN